MVLWTMRANKSAEKDTVEWERDQKRLRELECSVSEEAAARDTERREHLRVVQELQTLRVEVHSLPTASFLAEKEFQSKT